MSILVDFCDAVLDGESGGGRGGSGLRQPSGTMLTTPNVWFKQHGLSRPQTKQLLEQHSNLG